MGFEFTWRDRLAKVLLSASTVAGGAFLTATYLDWAIERPLPEVALARSLSVVAYFCLAMAHNWVNAHQEQGQRIGDISPAWAGTTVVALTGCATAIAVTIYATDLIGYLIALSVLAATFLLAIHVWRYASKNRDSVGAARFGVGQTAEHP